MRVSISVGCADSLDCVKYFLAKLFFKSVGSLILLFVVSEKFLVREGTWHVNADLVSVDCGKFGVEMLYQSQIITV